MLEKDLTKLALAACLHGEEVLSLWESLAEIGTMMQDAGGWSDTLAIEEISAPGFGALVYPDGFGEAETSGVLRKDTVVPFEGNTLSSSERLTGRENCLAKENVEYVAVPKVIGGKEQT